MHDFWANVKIGGPDDCWIWQGTKKHDGYGMFGRNVNVGEPTRLAHRIAWFLTFGKIPEGFLVCHNCDNPPCCNPYHLWLGTEADNKNDMMAKGRQSKGVCTYKLSPDDVKAIRNDPRSERKIAADYNVHRSTIGAIKAGKTWAGIPE